MAVIQHTGDVLWLPAAIFRSTCSVDILYFPFDVQICKLKFGSWTYDGFKLDVHFHTDIGPMVRYVDFVWRDYWGKRSHSMHTQNVKFLDCTAGGYTTQYNSDIKVHINKVTNL